MNLEVVWNGAHRNADRDLLIAMTVPHKRLGREPDAPRAANPMARTRDVIRRCAEIRATIRVCLSGGRALTIPRLAVETGFSEDEIRGGIQGLQRRGSIASEAGERALHASGSGQRAWTAYRWVSA